MNAAGGARTLRVVVHLDEAAPRRQRLALANVANLLDAAAASGETVEVEVVLNGPAVAAARRSGDAAFALGRLQARGVVLVACANSLRTTGIDASELLADVVVVPAGVAHLVRRQHEGWAYVRP